LAAHDNIKMAASFFHTKSKSVTTNKVPKSAVGSGNDVDTTRLVSDNPEIRAFYAQLSDKERIAHTIAIDKLGTSYDVTRTHGYLKWLKNRTPT
jgi:hypothetical protein